MCNAISKAICAAAAALALAACSSDPDKAAADDFAAKAQACLDAGNYQEALAMMDSVDQRYPAQIEARRKVTALRPKAMAVMMMRQMEQTDSIIAFAMQEIDQLEPLMKHIDGGDLEGYYVVADAFNPNFINATGMEPRVNDADFNFYIVAQSQGKKIDIARVALVGNGEAESEPMPAETARRMVVEGSEIASFLPEEVEMVGAWAAQPGNEVKGGKIIGAKSTQSVKFTAPQAASFATAYQYAAAKKRLKSATNLRVNLEKKLQLARDQVAQTSIAEEAEAAQ